MANNKEHVTEKYVTGKGELTGFISVIKPSTKYDAKGKDGYIANILLDKTEGEALVNKLKEVRAEQFKKYGKGTKVADLPCKPYETVDKETGEATPDTEGRYIFKTKASAYIENGKPKFKPALYNAKCKPVNNISIGEGTVAKLAVTLSGYSVAGKTGVSAKLGAVQIIDLVEYSGGAFSANTFDEEEGFEGVGEEFTEDTVATEEVAEDGEGEEADF